MKAPKILIAGLLALFTAAVAPAQETIHITGSTAYRSAVHQAILDMLGGTVSYGYSGTAGVGKASQAIFTGTVSNINVTIKTSWSGSLAGLETVAQAIPGATVSTFLVNSTPMSSGGTQNAPANYDPPTIPEVGMEDGEQAHHHFPHPCCGSEQGRRGCVQMVVQSRRCRWIDQHYCKPDSGAVCSWPSSPLHVQRQSRMQ